MSCPITVEQVRLHLSLGIEDDAVQDLIDAAWSAITGVAGELGDEVTETRDGGFSYVFLGRPARSVTSITETVGTIVTTLAADDYELNDDGVSLRRRGDGTNAPLWTYPTSRWYGRVRVVYAPIDDLGDRIRVALELIALDAPGGAALSSGIVSEQTGSHTIQYAQGAGTDVATIRAAILSTLLAGSIRPPGFA